jgi:hypothetical protein
METGNAGTLVRTDANTRAVTKESNTSQQESSDQAMGNLCHATR